MPYIAPVPPPMFQPSDPDAILAAMADPTRSLDEIAAANRTTLHALALWISRPDVAARLDDLDALSARRTRSAASSTLPAVAATLHAIVRDFLTRPAEADPALRLRGMESARRAAAVLVRLARFAPGPAPHATRAPASPGRASEGRVPGRAATVAAPTPMQGSIPPPTPAAAPSPPDAVPHAAAHHQRPSAPLQPPPSRELPPPPHPPDGRPLGAPRPAAHLIAAAGLPGP